MLLLICFTDTVGMSVKMESFRNDTSVTERPDVAAAGHSQESVSNVDHTAVEYSQPTTGFLTFLYLSIGFCPNNAMLARVLAMTLCLCLSQVGVLLKWLDGLSWFLACRLLSTYTTLCYKEIQVFAKIKNFVPYSGLRKFCLGGSIIKTCYQLSLRKVDAQSMVNWTFLCQLG